MQPEAGVEAMRFDGVRRETLWSSPRDKPSLSGGPSHTPRIGLIPLDPRLVLEGIKRASNAAATVIQSRYARPRGSTRRT